MARGRKALAPEVKEASGAYEKDPQRRNKLAPRANGKAPDAPDWFDDVERAKWSELVSDLSTMGVLSSECREMLIAYCTAYSGWMKARAEVAKGGLLVTEIDKQGNSRQRRNPASTEMHKFREQLNKLLPEFGLTPSSRGRLVSMNLENEDDPFAALLERMSGLN